MNGLPGGSVVNWLLRPFRLAKPLADGSNYLLHITAGHAGHQPVGNQAAGITVDGVARVCRPAAIGRRQLPEAGKRRRLDSRGFLQCREYPLGKFPVNAIIPSRRPVDTIPAADHIGPVLHRHRKPQVMIDPAGTVCLLIQYPAHPDIGNELCKPVIIRDHRVHPLRRCLEPCPDHHLREAGSLPAAVKEDTGSGFPDRLPLPAVTRGRRHHSSPGAEGHQHDKQQAVHGLPVPQPQCTGQESCNRSPAKRATLVGVGHS